MVSGPESARMVEEFEDDIATDETQSYQEQKPGVQSAFAKDVRNVVSSIEELGNPFLEEGNELMEIHEKDVMDAAVVATVQNVKKERRAIQKICQRKIPRPNQAHYRSSEMKQPPIIQLSEQEDRFKRES